MTEKMTAIDLFSGCGGISCGLERAGFRLLAGIDVEEAYLQTYRINFPQALSLVRDLSQTEPSALMAEVGVTRATLNLLAGGPPCQGFSKNVPRRSRYLEDPKNQLVASFLHFADALRPRFILMENVAEMKAGFEGNYTNLLIESLEAKHLGYSVIHGIVNAPDFGVPQRRRRTFFLASRDGEKIAFPTPTHAKTGGLDLFAPEGHVTVWDALGDLPPLEHGEGRDPCDYAAAAQNPFQQWARQGSEQIFNHVARRLQPTQYRRLAVLEPGQGIKDLPDELRPKSGYSGAYGRLTKSMVAPTITRWVFHPGSGRYGHPVQPRVITIREAARLQAFPDTFRFAGTYIQQSHQVGNAVPPLLAELIGRSLTNDWSHNVASHSANVSKLTLSSSVGAGKSMLSG
jgi:DNA (cytosine-5)-methyltransferase 1